MSWWAAVRDFLSAVLSNFGAVFVVVDPFALLPIYLGMVENFALSDRRQVARRATTIAAVILMVFCLSGMWIFGFFGITLGAFQIAGGILLLRLGIAQLTAERRRVRAEEVDENHARDDISVFPMATPLLAGPGAISTVVLLSSRCESWTDTAALIIAIVVAMLVGYIILHYAHQLYRVLGRTGLNLLTRLMGILLTAVAVQFVINGIKSTIELLRQ